MGFPNQSPRLQFEPITGCTKLVGRCKTTLWLEFAYEDPDSYDLELQAVDSCQQDDDAICAAGGYVRAAVWGELLSTAAKNAGCVGAVVDGTVRDVAKMTDMGFPVFARGRYVYDAMHRPKVVDLDVEVEISGVRLRPGEIVIADRDGVVVVPKEVEEEAIQKAWKKIHDENRVREEIANGMKATEAWKRYGIL